MLPITYGWCAHDSYIDAGEAIARDFLQVGISRVVAEMNIAFFKGGVFAPKSFSDLASDDIPERPWTIVNDMEGRRVEIRKRQSESPYWGYVEAIPLIGSVLAVIGVIGHLFYMASSYQALKNAVEVLRATQRSDYNMGRGACKVRTDQVFNAAVAYTDHRNQLIGSMLSIIPLAKPIVRLAQGLLYESSVRRSVVQ